MVARFRHPVTFRRYAVAPVVTNAAFDATTATGGTRFPVTFPAGAVGRWNAAVLV